MSVHVNVCSYPSPPLCGCAYFMMKCLQASFVCQVMAVNLHIPATTPHPHPPLPQSLTVMSSRVPHITDMLSVFELVLYRVEDQRSIFMQCDYLEYLILI